jgi:hypothetical protein
MVSQHAPNKYGAETLELNNNSETFKVGMIVDNFELPAQKTAVALPLQREEYRNTNL